MKPIQQALPRVIVPRGFSGWWCERCERACPSIPEEAGSPAKCPHCKKYTAVWVPAPGGAATIEREPAPYVRTRPTAEHAKQLFEEMKRVGEGLPPTTDEDYKR